jgi:hypothetical protein
MPDRLIPLAEAAARLGLSPKTLRNRASARRAGLAAGPTPPLHRVGSRLFVREADVERFIDTATSTSTTPGDLGAELRELADQVGGVFPDAADRMRTLAARAGLSSIDGGRHA